MKKRIEIKKNRENPLWKRKRKVMKIAAFIEEPGLIARMNPKEEARLYQKMKEESGADALIAVICGEFLQEGITVRNNKYQHAEHLKEQGIDLIVELPVYCILNTFDTYAFAAISTLEKMNCVDELIILCTGEGEKINREIRQSLFAESKNYKDNELNRHAVEYGKAIKRLYSTMKVRFFSVDREERNQYQPEENVRLFQDELWKVFKKKMDEIGESEREQYLNEISGGYAPMTKKILELYKKDETFNLVEKNLVTDKRKSEDLRRYILKTLVGIRQVEISICGLYSYALYVNILINENEELTNNRVLEVVNKKTWIPLILKNNLMEENAIESDQQSKFDQLDDSRKMLLLIEKNAEILYRRLVTL